MAKRSGKELWGDIRSLPWRHQLMLAVGGFLVVDHVLYLTHFFLGVAHGWITYTPPTGVPVECEYREDNSGAPPAELSEGGVRFNVDMRCFDTPFKEVYLTGLFCQDCGPEGWNLLEDPDGDGIYSVDVSFQADSGEPRIGMGFLYRYAVKAPGGGSVYENLHDDMAEGAVCGRVSDPNGPLRNIVTEPWAVSAWDVFGSCTGDGITRDQIERGREKEYLERNPWVARTVDPVWEPLDRTLSRVLVLDPVLFLSLCSLYYLWSVIVIGWGYSTRKEKLVLDALAQAQHKNTYLEHAAKILRHDMHSGINTYLPRGVRSLEKRLGRRPEITAELKLEAPLKLLKEGLAHTRRVYQGVTEFTNLVRDGVVIQKTECDLKVLLSDYLDMTSYKDQVIIDDLPTVAVNPSLFCTAIDNLIRNGLKYNDSSSRMVIIAMNDPVHLGVIDNGRGLSQEEFDRYSKAYSRKAGQKEKGSGLGLNICIAILHEHNFAVSCHKREDQNGTIIKVKIL
jgi:signal transduction histidine kinase